MNKVFSLILFSVFLTVGTVCSVGKVVEECEHSEEDLDQYVDALRVQICVNATQARLTGEEIEELIAVLYDIGFRAAVKELVDDPGYKAVIKIYGVDKKSAERDPRMIAARHRFNLGLTKLLQQESARRDLAR